MLAYPVDQYGKDFCRSCHLHRYFVYASSTGFCEYVEMRRLSILPKLWDQNMKKYPACKELKLNVVDPVALTMHITNKLSYNLRISVLWNLSFHASKSLGFKFILLNEKTHLTTCPTDALYVTDLRLSW